MYCGDSAVLGVAEAMPVSVRGRAGVCPVSVGGQSGVGPRSVEGARALSGICPVVSPVSARGRSRGYSVCPEYAAGDCPGSVRSRSSESGVGLGAMPGRSGVGLVSVWSLPGGK